MSVVLPDNDFYFDILENKLAMRRQDIGFITCFSIFSLFFFAPVQVSAQAIIGEAEEQLGETVGRTGVAQTDVATAAGEVVRIVLSGVGIVFFILMVYAGIRWMTARGEEEAVTKARKAMIAASIGLVIIVSAYGFSVLVTSGLLKGVETRGGPAGTVGGEGGGVDIGCCYDKIERSTGLLEFANEYWTWRMATQEECETRGNTEEELDVLTGDIYWEWFAQNAEECEAGFEDVEDRDTY